MTNTGTLIGTGSAFTYLQMLPDITPTSLPELKNVAIAGAISLGSQLLLKLGNKLIDKIGAKRRKRKAEADGNG